MSRNSSVPMPEKSRVVETGKPVSTGTRNVAPNIAMTCCAPIATVARPVQALVGLHDLARFDGPAVAVKGPQRHARSLRSGDGASITLASTGAGASCPGHAASERLERRPRRRCVREPM